MGEVIGRCVSRHAALRTFERVLPYIPGDEFNAYRAALNRTRYEFNRHDPVKPDGDHCGSCGAMLLEDAVYCWNCGREIYRN